jgi:hypothetical protein
VHSSLGDDVGVQSVAEINGVNVVTVNRRLAFNPGNISNTRFRGANFDTRSNVEKGRGKHTIPSHCT